MTKSISIGRLCSNYAEPLTLRSRIQCHQKWLTKRCSRKRDEAVILSFIPGTVPTIEVEIEAHQQGEVIGRFPGDGVRAQHLAARQFDGAASLARY
jgi:hypothetical protein